jgi:hypothetical protein
VNPNEIKRRLQRILDSPADGHDNLLRQFAADLRAANPTLPDNVKVWTKRGYFLEAAYECALKSVFAASELAEGDNIITVSGNTTASNSDFSEKKVWLKKSLLALNLEIIDLPKWDEDEIALRGKMMLELLTCKTRLLAPEAVHARAAPIRTQDAKPRHLPVYRYVPAGLSRLPLPRRVARPR